MLEKNVAGATFFGKSNTLSYTDVSIYYLFFVLATGQTQRDITAVLAHLVSFTSSDRASPVPLLTMCFARILAVFLFWPPREQGSDREGSGRQPEDRRSCQGG